MTSEDATYFNTIKQVYFFSDTEEEEETEDEAEVKHVMNGAEDQSIAKTVFSLLQKLRHPDLTIHLTPNIVITPSQTRVLMFDAENDILLCSNPM